MYWKNKNVLRIKEIQQNKKDFEDINKNLVCNLIPKKDKSQNEMLYSLFKQLN